MKRLVVLVGPPGSGKSTKAKAYEELSKYTRINRDDQGKKHFYLFDQALEKLEDIVVDKMNFSKESRAYWIDKAHAKGYVTKIIVFHVPFSVCLDRMAERENHPTIKTAEDALKALNFFFRAYARVEDKEADTVERLGHNNDVPTCIVSDLDGTLCRIDHRLHHVRGEGRKDWQSFFREIPDDSVNEWCREILWKFQDSYPIVLASGRGEQTRSDTTEWLHKHGIQYNALYMRPSIDNRPDFIVKEIILEFEILPRYRPLFILDDRASVVKMWRKHGLTVLQCDEGNF